MQFAKSTESILTKPSYTDSMPVAACDKIFRALGYHLVHILGTSWLIVLTD